VNRLRTKNSSRTILGLSIFNRRYTDEKSYPVSNLLVYLSGLLQAMERLWNRILQLVLLSELY